MAHLDFYLGKDMEIATPDYSGVGTVTAINNRHVGEFGVSGDNRRNYSFVGRDGRIIPINRSGMRRVRVYSPEGTVNGPKRRMVIGGTR
ncbi:MAG TPA: hypothetical protein VJK07_03265 [Candidatus Nanoarchaeia archaeon]|nr:hypothetical protein [Candidatus Nanoarchaeia archaeon]